MSQEIRQVRAVEGQMHSRRMHGFMNSAIANAPSDSTCTYSREKSLPEAPARVHVSQLDRYQTLRRSSLSAHATPRRACSERQHESASPASLRPTWNFKTTRFQSCALSHEDHNSDRSLAVSVSALAWFHASSHARLCDEVDASHHHCFHIDVHACVRTCVRLCRRASVLSCARACARA
eukprot:6194238-Pleurochrysis_carterae.AAC.1